MTQPEQESALGETGLPGPASASEPPPADQWQLPRRFGRYEVIEQVGQGGVAIVFRAYDPSLNRPVALKVLRPRLAVDAALVTRFAIEARLVARMNHPNAVTIYEVGEAEGHPYLALQFVAGGSLAAFLARHGPLAVEHARVLLEQVANALDHAHRAGVIHRDLKPANILLDDDNRRALLADFGIARAVESTSRITQTGTTIGTAAYMAPEQVTEDIEVGPATDQYALAIVA